MAVVRVYVGSFMTSLDMTGISLSLMRVISTADLEALDFAVNVAGWPSHGGLVPRTAWKELEKPEASSEANQEKEKSATLIISPDYAVKVSAALVAAANAVIKLEEQLTDWDGKVGDGDAGMTFKRGADRIVADAGKDLYASECDAAAVWMKLADGIRESMGGTSGIVLDIFSRSMASSLSSASSSTPAEQFSAALKGGVAAISYYGGAKPGMSTLLDALAPASDAVSAAVSSGDCDLKSVMSKAAKAAMTGAESTKTMKAMAGRASYVNQEDAEGIPDPGAMALAHGLQAAADSL